MDKGIKLERPTFTVEVKYSPEAIEKKLMKFTLVGEEKSFEISAEEMASMLVGQVNSETLAATFVETDKVNVVEVGRQIQCVLDKDYQKGQVININYFHPLPIEFAIIEEAAKIAKINMDTPAFTLTAEYIKEVEKKIKPEMEKYIETFYKSFKNLPKK